MHRDEKEHDGKENCAADGAHGFGHLRYVWISKEAEKNAKKDGNVTGNACQRP